MKRRPKLCYVLPKFDPASEEHFFHVYQLLEHLSRSLDLYVLVERSSGQLRLPAARVYTQRFGLPLRILEALVVILWIRFLGYRRFYVHYSYIGAVLASAVARLTGATVYYWNCGLAKMFFRKWRLDAETITAKLTAEVPLRLSLAVIDHLVTGTPGMADYYARELGVARERTIVLPNEIDVERFSGPFDRIKVRGDLGCEHREVVLFVHRLSPRKGAELLPEIVRRVSQARPRVLFLIAGDGPSRRVIERRIADEGLEQHARFLGWVPNRDVQRLYAAADVYLLPSNEEGFPRVLLEAMAAGLPIAATDVGGVREILPPEQSQWLAPVGDTAAIATRVIELLRHESVRTDLATTLRRHVRRYDLPVVADMFVRSIGGA